MKKLLFRRELSLVMVPPKNIVTSLQNLRHLIPETDGVEVQFGCGGGHAAVPRAEFFRFPRHRRVRVMKKFAKKIVARGCGFHLQPDCSENRARALEKKTLQPKQHRSGVISMAAKKKAKKAGKKKK